MKKIFYFLVAIFILAAGSPVWANFYVIGTPAGVGTRIRALPYTINTSGFYYLCSDLSSTGDGITINVDDVTIDLMGFSLNGTGTGSTIGIDLPGRKNIEIRNGTVKGFTNAGILSVVSGKNNRVINVRLHDNSIGIHLVGSNHLIQNCNSSENSSKGIWTNGYSCMIINNISCHNGSTGIDCTGQGHTLIGNIIANNTGLGLNLSYVGSGPYYYLIDKNNVYNNTGGNINGDPPSASWGLNAGIP